MESRRHRVDAAASIPALAGFDYAIRVVHRAHSLLHDLRSDRGMKQLHEA